MHTSINQLLTDELLFLIFQHCNVPTVLLSSAVCKRWNRICFDTALWFHLFKCSVFSPIPSASSRHAKDFRGNYWLQEYKKHYLMIQKWEGSEWHSVHLRDQVHDSQRVNVIRYNVYDQQILSCGFDGNVGLTSATEPEIQEGEGRRLSHLSLTGGRGMSMDWQPDCNLWAAGMDEGPIHVGSVQHGDQLQLDRQLIAHSSSVNALCIGRAEPLLYSCSYDGTILCWNLSAASSSPSAGAGGGGGGGAVAPITPQLSIGAHRTKLYALCEYSGQGGERLLFSGGEDRLIKMFDINQMGTCVQTFVGHTLGVSALLHCNSHHLISGGWDGTVRVWDVRATSSSTGTACEFHVAHRGAVYALHQQGHYIVSAGGDGKVVCFDSRRSSSSSTRLTEFRHFRSGRGIDSVQSDDSHIFTAGRDGINIYCLGY